MGEPEVRAALDRLSPELHRLLFLAADRPHASPWRRERGRVMEAAIHFDRPLEAVLAELKAIAATQAAQGVILARIESTQEKLMSEDAAVLAVVTDEQAQVTALGASVGALQALVTALQAEVAAGGTALQPSTLAALQAAEASLDTLAETGAADVSSDTPAAPAAPPSDPSVSN